MKTSSTVAILGKWGGDTARPDIPGGEFTLVSPSGGRRTVRIRRQANDSTFAPGERVVAVLTGPDNSEWGSWTAVAFLRATGLVVFKKHQGTAHEATVRFALRALEVQARGGDLAGVEILASARCARCNRALTVPSSIHAGMGPECASK